MKTPVPAHILYKHITFDTLKKSPSIVTWILNQGRPNAKTAVCFGQIFYAIQAGTYTHALEYISSKVK